MLAKQTGCLFVASKFERENIAYLLSLSLLLLSSREKQSTSFVSYSNRKLKGAVKFTARQRRQGKDLASLSFTVRLYLRWPVDGRRLGAVVVAAIAATGNKNGKHFSFPCNISS